VTKMNVDRVRGRNVADDEIGQPGKGGSRKRRHPCRKRRQIKWRKVPNSSAAG